MAHITDHAPAEGIFSRFLDLLVRMGENSARAQMLQKISTLTDDQIKAMGTTRAELVQRAVSAGAL